jgi:predicted peptidase
VVGAVKNGYMLDERSNLVMGNEEHLFKQEVTRTVRLPYLLFLPSEYGTDADKEWPLILFLHGLGERGDDLERVKKHGLPKILDERDDFSFIVVSPQCPADSFWSVEIPALSALLDEVIERFAVDTSRIYLTGLSMGGYGTWHLAAAHPERFAAIAPICGGIMFYAKTSEKLKALADLPVWAFHGARDRTVQLAESADIVSALKAQGANVRFTIYPDAEHDSWTDTYNNPQLYEWFLVHSR